MGSMWDGLQVFLDDPNVAIDNNATERAMRGVVLGRKNHYGSRSRRGTEVAALFYSLIESAKLVGVGPHTYLLTATDAALRGVEIPLPHQLA
jgi:transposase